LWNVSSGPLLSIEDKNTGAVTGESRAVTVLGFGGFNRDGLVLEAKKDMIIKKPLKEKEYYANMTVTMNTKSIFGFLVVIRKVIVSADVMTQDTAYRKPDVLKIPRNPTVTSAGNAKFFIIEPDTFRVGEKVYGNIGFKENEYFNLEVVSVNGKRATFGYVDQEKPYVTVKPAFYRFFSTTKSLSGFKHKDQVFLNSVASSKRLGGVVLGVTHKYVLILTGEGVDYYPPSRLEMVK
jgi:hypothetical protein